MSDSTTFTVYIYEQEKNYLEWLVLQRQNIETGGDLFGLWQNEDLVIAQLILGPGKCCSRTETSFYQDIEYLSSVGNELTTYQGLCNIGEWHSHHRIDLPSPSQGDQTTVWNHMESVAGGRFLLFIASITGSKKNPIVNVNCFMFSSETKKMSEGLLVTLQGSSPIRGQFNDVSFEPGPEEDVNWGDFVEAVKSHGIKNQHGVRNESKEMNQTKPAVILGKEHKHEKTSIAEDRNESESCDSKEKQHHHKKTNSGKSKNFSKSPREVNLNEPAVTQSKGTIIGSQEINENKQVVGRGNEYLPQKPSTRKEPTDKTKLKSCTQNTTYGSTNQSEYTGNVPTGPAKKKKSKKHSQLTTSSSRDNVITSQPLRDLAAPIPKSGSNNGCKTTSIFDCCSGCKYNKLNEEE